MQSKLEKSIELSSKLLKTPLEYEKYISIKLSPPSGCCCSDCWPDTWETINNFISPYGPIEHGGEALIEKGKDKFVLKSHETGPEIIIYIALVTASLTLLKSIIDLINTIVKGLSTESRKQPPRIKISKRQIIKGNIKEEILLEIEIPISKNTVKQIEESIKTNINL